MTDVHKFVQETPSGNLKTVPVTPAEDASTPGLTKPSGSDKHPLLMPHATPEPSRAPLAISNPITMLSVENPSPPAEPTLKVGLPGESLRRQSSSSTKLPGLPNPPGGRSAPVQQPSQAAVQPLLPAQASPSSATRSPSDGPPGRLEPLKPPTTPAGSNGDASSPPHLSGFVPGFAGGGGLLGASPLPGTAYGGAYAVPSHSTLGSAVPAAESTHNESTRRRRSSIRQSVINHTIDNVTLDDKDISIMSEKLEKLREKANRRDKAEMTRKDRVWRSSKIMQQKERKSTPHSREDWELCWQSSATSLLNEPVVVRHLDHEDRDPQRPDYKPSMEKGEDGKPRPKISETISHVLTRVMNKRLYDIELERPTAARIYDPQNISMNFIRWSGTAVRLAFIKWDFWLLLILHIGFSCYYHGWEHPDDADDEFPKVELDTMLITGSFLVFFMVFFNGQAYNRFFTQYFMTRKIEFSLVDTFILIRTHLDNPVKQLAMTRLLHAMHYLAYAFMPQNRDLNGFIHAMWKHMENTRLLTRREVQDLRLTQNIAAPNGECLLWMLRLMRTEMNEARMKPPIFRAFEAKLHTVNDNFEELEAFAQQPIPFAYYHLMVWICETYLVCLAYIAAFVTPWYSIVGYLMSLVALLGLREAAACLSDPLGFDESDIPIFDSVAKLHFEHVLQLTMRPHQPVVHHLMPPLGFGSKECFTHIIEGVMPADFQPGGMHENHVEEKTEDRPLPVPNEDQVFWDEIALGRFDLQLLKGIVDQFDQDMTPVDDDDDDDDFEDYAND